MSNDAEYVHAVRKLLSFLNDELNHSYREISGRQQNISIDSIKQFKSKTEVNYRKESGIVRSLTDYILEYREELEAIGDTKILTALDLVETGDGNKTFHDKAVVRTYAQLYKLLGIDHSNPKYIERMDELTGTYLVRQERTTTVYSALIVRRKELNEADSEVWEFVHLVKFDFDARRSDGIASDLKPVLYLGGDIENGTGVELFSFKLPPNTSASVFSGLLMSLDENHAPYTAKVTMIRVRDRSKTDLFLDASQTVLNTELENFLDSEDVSKAMLMLVNRHNSM